MEEKKIICPKCNQEVSHLTRDHIIPKSFVAFAVQTGAIYLREWNKKWPQYPITQKICQKCNSDKSSKLMIDHPPTIDLLKIVSEHLQYQVKVADRWLAKNPSVPPPIPETPKKSEVKTEIKQALDTGEWRQWNAYEAKE